LGVSGSTSPEVIGIIAFVPSAAVLLSQELKLQPKANYFYGAAAGFRKIRAKCQFGDDPTLSISALALEMAELQSQLNQDWDTRLTFAWGEPARSSEQVRIP
jgi:hypothetical protein